MLGFSLLCWDARLIDQWVGSNVDLNLLSERLSRFFDGNQFDTRLVQDSGKSTIFASNGQFRLRVNVYGRADDFTVEFIPSKKTRGFSLTMLLGYVTTFFGGGTFMLRDIKLQEAINRLEQVFWKQVDIDVADLNKAATTE